MVIILRNKSIEKCMHTTASDHFYDPDSFETTKYKVSHYDVSFKDRVCNYNYYHDVVFNENPPAWIFSSLKVVSAYKDFSVDRVEEISHYNFLDGMEL